MNTALIKEGLEPIGKVIEKLYDNWFLEFLILLAYILVVFATQAALVPPELLQNSFNIFIALIVIGLSVYWYICNNLCTILIFIFVTYKSKSSSKFDGDLVTITGLLYSTVSLIASSSVFYIVRFFIEYETWIHFCVFVLSHILLFIFFIMTLRIIVKNSKVTK